MLCHLPPLWHLVMRFHIQWLMHDLVLTLIKDVNVTPFLWPIFEGIGSATESCIKPLCMQKFTFCFSSSFIIHVALFAIVLILFTHLVYSQRWPLGSCHKSRIKWLLVTPKWLKSSKTYSRSPMGNDAHWFQIIFVV